MRIFCPIDFSEVSINASRWAANFLKEYPDSELHLSHFIFFKRRAGMFMKVDNIFEERAKEDFEQLTKELQILSPGIKIDYSIYSANPKEAIASVAKSKEFDLVILGSSGLTAIKNMTIGSVAESVINTCRRPVIAIPGGASWRGISKIALAVDDEIIENLSALSTLRDMVEKSEASLHLIHVEEKGDSPYEYDPGVDMYLRGIDYNYEKLKLVDTLTKTINIYCQENGVDLLCMVHHKRNWLQKILTKSITKAELFHLNIPLLVLNQ